MFYNNITFEQLKYISNFSKINFSKSGKILPALKKAAAGVMITSALLGGCARDKGNECIYNNLPTQIKEVTNTNKGVDLSRHHKVLPYYNLVDTAKDAISTIKGEGKPILEEKQHQASKINRDATLRDLYDEADLRFSC